MDAGGGGLGNLADELADAWDEEEGEEDEDDDETRLHQTWPKQQQQHFHHGLKNGYDGSDYGRDSDFEDDHHLSPGLERKMAEIESLARRGLGNNRSENDRVVERVIASLRDLGTQSAIENSAMRFVCLFWSCIILN